MLATPVVGFQIVSGKMWCTSLECTSYICFQDQEVQILEHMDGWITVFHIQKNINQIKQNVRCCFVELELSMNTLKVSY